MTVTVLGKSCNLLCLLADAVFERFRLPFVIEIVKNIEVGDGPEYRMRNMPGIGFREIHMSDWDGTAEALMLGVIRVKTKILVLNDFLEKTAASFDRLSTCCHPAAVVSAQSEVGNGVFIGPNAVVAPYATLGDMVTVNRSATIGHHTVVGRLSTINPGSHIAGGCRIGECVTIGMGACVVDGVAVGDNAVVGAGSLVTRDIPSGVVAYGSPARVVRDNNVASLSLSAQRFGGR